MTSNEIKAIQDEEQKQIEISDLADKFLDEAMAKGDPFSEGLTNWAINKAMQTLGS